MFRKPILVALVALIAFGSVFVSTPDAHANSLTDSANRAAQQATQFAARKTAQASSVQARLSSEQAKFVAAVRSGDKMRIHYAKRSFIMYLQSLRSALAQAKTAHTNAIRALQYYRRVSGNNAVVPTINSFAAAVNRFDTTIGQVNAGITAVASVK